MPTEREAIRQQVLAVVHYDGASAAADFERDHGPFEAPRTQPLAAVSRLVADAFRAEARLLPG